MYSMAWSKGLDVEAGRHGVVSHAGSAATRLLADRAGLTLALSGALARRGFTPVHDRGPVLTDLAVAIADGAATIGEIGTLRHQGERFGPVASDTTVWRALAGVRRRGPGPGQQGPGEGPPSRVGADRGAARRHPVGPGGGPCSGPGDRDPPRRHDRRGAQREAAGQGHVQGHVRPLPADARFDNTSESLAVLLRPGNNGVLSSHIRSRARTPVIPIPGRCLPVLQRSRHCGGTLLLKEAIVRSH